MKELKLKQAEYTTVTRRIYYNDLKSKINLARNLVDAETDVDATQPKLTAAHEHLQKASTFHFAALIYSLQSLESLAQATASADPAVLAELESRIAGLEESVQETNAKGDAAQATVAELEASIGQGIVSKVHFLASHRVLLIIAGRPGERSAGGTAGARGSRSYAD